METVELDGIDYSRQLELTDQLRQLDRNVMTKKYIIVGCGGIGFWAGILLAMFGIKELILIDGQKIESSNLNRLPVPPTWVGTNKAIALRRIIRQMRPATVINCIVKNVNDENIDVLKSLTVGQRCTIIDTTDDARIQKKIYDCIGSDSVSVHYIKIGYEGLDVGWYPRYDIWIPDNYQPGYRTTQSNVLSSAISAGLGLLSAFWSNYNTDVKINLAELADGSMTGRVKELEQTIKDREDLIREQYELIKKEEVPNG
jgi:hypothetical protein